RYRIEEEQLRRFRLAAAPARRLVQVQHLRPRLRELLLHRATGDLNEKGVARADVEQRTTHAGRRVVGGHAQVDGQDVDLLQRAGRALVEHVEAADRGDLVTPHLDTHRLGRAEAEQVEDPAAQRVLANALDQRRT